MNDTPTPEDGATPNSPTGGHVGITLKMIEDAYKIAVPAATPEQLESILWLFRYAKTNKVPGNAAVGKLLTPPRDQSSISKLFSGKYGAGLETICADIDRLRAFLVQNAQVDGEPVVRLPWMTEEVHNFAELVYATRDIGFIWGPNQSGKSVSIDAHVAGSKRRTIRVNMPDGAIKTEFLDACFEAIGESKKKANGEKKTIFSRYLNRDTELIIDEFHQCWVGGTVRANVVEMIRRWRDLRGCSVLLVCTNLDGLTDKRFGNVLDQMANRGLFRLFIPTKPRPEDVTAIIDAYGLRPPAPGSKEAEIVSRVCNASGLGKLCKWLKGARYLANNRGEVLAWRHLVQTDEYVTACAGGNAGTSGKGGN